MADSNVPITAGSGTNIDTFTNAASEHVQKVGVYHGTDAMHDGTQYLTPKFAAISASTSGASLVVAAVTGKRIRVLSLSLTASAAVNVKFQSHTTPTDITGLYYCAANGGFVLPFSPVGHFQTVSGEQLDINLSSAVPVGGQLVYVEV